MAYKCLFAIAFLACQVHTQASVEVQSGTSLIFTLPQNQPGHQTGVIPGNDVTGSCQIEVTATASCNGQNSGDVTISIPSSTPSQAGCPEPQCPSCPVTFCPSWPASSYHSSLAPQCPSCPAPQCHTMTPTPSHSYSTPSYSTYRTPSYSTYRTPSYSYRTPSYSTYHSRSYSTYPTPSYSTSPPPPPSATTTPPAGLLRGYEHVPNLGCYKYHTSRALWAEAKQICEEEGTHLLILNSEDEAEAIGNIMRRDRADVNAYRDYSWLGLVESNTTQHEYKTIFGDPLSATGFSKWSHEEAQHTSLGDNVLLYSREGSLVDEPGKGSYAFTCEQFTC